MTKKIIQVCAIDSTMNGLLRELNTQLIKEGYDLIGICSKGKVTNKMRDEGFNIINIDIYRHIKPLSNIKSIYKLYKLFKKEKPDIVHVHTPIASVLGRIAAKLAKIPNIVYTAHGFYFNENMSPIKYKIFLNIEKYMAKYFTDIIFTQSEEDRKTALENNFIDENKIVTIGNGVDVWGKFNPDNIDIEETKKIYKEFGINEDNKIITFVGRLVKEKGIFDLLEAFKLLNNNRLKLLIVGDISQGSRDEKTKIVLEKYKNLENVIFTGYRKDVNRILNVTDIFCIPSYREGMPRSIIEAMSMECAVIATNIRGCREEVVDGVTGFLVPLKSPHEIASKINKILSNEEDLRIMKEKGRKRAEKYFNEIDIVKKQLKVFDRLLSLRKVKIKK